jgi:NADH-quinone oxidoreductase subunit J
MLDAQLLAALQVLVYAGAIMVLFLFVIMLLNLGGEQIQTDPLAGQRPLAALFGVALLLSLGVTFRQWAAHAPPPRPAPLEDQIRLLGQTLFVKYVYPFEVTSILLLVAIIGTILLAKRKLGAAPAAEPRTLNGGPAPIPVEPERRPLTLVGGREPSPGARSPEPGAGGEADHV